MKRLKFIRHFQNPTLYAVWMVVFLALPFTAYSQTTYTWIGPNNGSWATAANWSPTRSSIVNSDILRFNSGQTLTIVSVPSQTIGKLLVINNSNIALTSTANQAFTIANSTGTDLLVESGSTLTISGTTRLRITLAANATADIQGELTLGTNGNINIPNTGSFFSVNGKLTNLGGSFNSTAAARMAFGPGAEYHHARNGTALPLATWNATSTLRLSAITSTTVGSTNQNFGNVIFQCPAQTVNMSFAATSIAGDLIINNGASTGQVRQTVNNIPIGGNFQISGGSYVIGNGNNSNRSLTVGGDAAITGGTLLMSISTNAIGNLLVAGDFTHSAGTINETSSGSGRITFNGTETQIFTSGGAVTNTIHYTINGGAVVHAAQPNTTFVGGGSFTLQAGATLGIQSPQGIMTSGATGLVRVTGARSYNSLASYIFNGSSNQSVGTGLPLSVQNLVIDNSGIDGNNTVSLSQNTSIASDLHIYNGIFDLGPFLANRSNFGGEILMADGASLRIGGTNTFPANFQTHSLNCHSTVAYTGTDQVVDGLNSPATYGILELDGSGTKTLEPGLSEICAGLAIGGATTVTMAGDLDVGGEFLLGPMAIFQTQNFTLQAADWNLQGLIEGADGQVIIDTATPVNIPSGSFGTLVLAGQGQKSLGGNIEILESIIVDSPVRILDGMSLTLGPDALMHIPADADLETLGTGRIILEPASRYLNYSSGNPNLEVKQQFTGQNGWRMIGTPVATTYADMLSNLETQGFPGSNNPGWQPNVLWFDETDKGTSAQAWRQPSQLSDMVQPGRGHYLFVFDGAEKPSGGNYADDLPLVSAASGQEPNLNSGTFDFGVSFTPRDTNLVADGNDFSEISIADAGFNLLANPTASYLDFFAPSGWNKTNIDNTIYVWDPETNAFLTHNGVLGTLGNGRIAPYQAFWVRTNATNPNLQLANNDAKTDIGKEFYGRVKRDEPFAVGLRLLGESMEAACFISFGRGGREGADAYDAYQLESLGKDWLFLYSYGSLRSSLPLVINHLPELTKQETVIPLHLAASKDGMPLKGDYILSWELPLGWPSDTRITLMDHVREQAIDMQRESAYSFSFEAPATPQMNARRAPNTLQLPQAVIFTSPFEAGDVTARKTSERPKRPFTIHIGEGLAEHPQEYLPDMPKLFAPYPNPFRYDTTIKFFLPEPTAVEVHVYDLMGKMAAQFPAKVYDTGTHEINWNTDGISISSGMYIVSLHAGDYWFTQKLIKS